MHFLQLFSILFPFTFCQSTTIRQSTTTSRTTFATTLNSNNPSLSTTRSSSSASQATSTATGTTYGTNPYPNVIAGSPPGNSFDFTGFPPVGQIVSPNPIFMQKYNFTSVPNHPIASPPESRINVDCNYLNSNTCSWLCSKCTKPMDITYCPNPLDWGFTFDDGPSPNTQVILNYLAIKKVKATFAVTGTQVLQNPNVLLQEYQMGNQIIIHTWSHRALTSLSTEVIVAELEWTAMAIEKVIGVRPKYFRPPYGDIDDRVRVIAQIMGFRPILWNYDTGDFSITMNSSSFVQDSADMVTRAAQNASLHASRSNGIISLEHDFWDQTAELSYKIGDAVLANGMFLKSVSECIGDTNPYFVPLNQSRFVPYTSISPTTTTSFTSTRTSTPTNPVLANSASKRGTNLLIFFSIVLLLNA